MKKKKNIRQRLFGYILLLGLLAIASTQLGWCIAEKQNIHRFA